MIKSASNAYEYFMQDSPQPRSMLIAYVIVWTLGMHTSILPVCRFSPLLYFMFYLISPWAIIEKQM